MQEQTPTKPPRVKLRERMQKIKNFRCKNLIAVLEEPSNYKNIGTVIRNVNALGVEKAYVIDSRNLLPNDWHEMRQTKSLSEISASAIKWSFVKKFASTEDCLVHLKRKGYASLVTSPHLKGRRNVVLHEGDYTNYSKLAIWFGNETRGISEAAIESSAGCINIPMYGLIESLNLGTTTGIVLYEVTKQRREYQSKYKRAGKRKPIEKSAQ